MCGRDHRLSDKQPIAEAFSVKVGLDEIYCEPETNISPGSLQPVIYLDENGDRRIEMMRWGFQLPDRLQFLARSETVDRAEFWKESCRERRGILPADGFCSLGQDSPTVDEASEEKMNETSCIGGDILPPPPLVCSAIGAGNRVPCSDRFL
jgi:putative SOS response-associated peptidase YedK